MENYAITYEPKDRGLSMVFQNYALYPNITVYGNLAYALRIRKVPKKEIKEKVHQVAKVLEIEQLLDQKTKRFIRWAETESCYWKRYYP